MRLRVVPWSLPLTASSSPVSPRVSSQPSLPAWEQPFSPASSIAWQQAWQPSSPPSREPLQPWRVPSSQLEPSSPPEPSTAQHVPQTSSDAPPQPQPSHRLLLTRRFLNHRSLRRRLHRSFRFCRRLSSLSLDGAGNRLQRSASSSSSSSSGSTSRAPVRRAPRRGSQPEDLFFPFLFFFIPELELRLSPASPASGRS